MIFVYILISNYWYFQVPIGIVIREREKNLTLSITAKKGQTLDILVENKDHLNFGSGINNNTNVGITDSQSLDILLEVNVI